MNNKPYHYIRAWGQELGSYEYYIARQIDEARASNAPDNAIYRGANKWETTDDIPEHNKQLVERLGRAVERMRDRAVKS